MHKVEIGLRHHWGGKLQHQNIFNPEFDDLKRAAIAIVSEPYFGCRNHGDFLQSGSVKQIFFVIQVRVGGLCITSGDFSRWLTELY